MKYKYLEPFLPFVLVKIAVILKTSQDPTLNSLSIIPFAIAALIVASIAHHWITKLFKDDTK